jgi:membrane-associated phospholipid phosphatase
MRFIKILLFISLLGTLVIYLFPRTWELDQIARLQENRTVLSVRFFQFISDSKSFITVGIPVLLIIISFVRPNKLLREKAFLVLFSLAVAGILSVAVKKIVREPRPYEVDSRITQLSGGGGYGFPSGHALEAVAAATAFSILWPELYIIVASVCWVLLTMISRIYLGVHDTGDVIGGMFLGILSFLIVMKIRDYVLHLRTKASR